MMGYHLMAEGEGQLKNVLNIDLNKMFEKLNEMVLIFTLNICSDYPK